MNKLSLSIKFNTLLLIGMYSCASEPSSNLGNQPAPKSAVETYHVGDFLDHSSDEFDHQIDRSELIERMDLIPVEFGEKLINELIIPSKNTHYSTSTLRVDSILDITMIPMNSILIQETGVSEGSYLVWCDYIDTNNLLMDEYVILDYRNRTMWSCEFGWESVAPISIRQGSAINIPFDWRDSFLPSAFIDFERYDQQLLDEQVYRNSLIQE